jgi:hypothetical protein
MELDRERAQDVCGRCDQLLHRLIYCWGSLAYYTCEFAELGCRGEEGGAIEHAQRRVVRHGGEVLALLIELDTLLPQTIDSAAALNVDSEPPPLRAAAAALVRNASAPVSSAKASGARGRTGGGGAGDHRCRGSAARIYERAAIPDEA